MFKKTYAIPLANRKGSWCFVCGVENVQLLRLVTFGDVHFDTDECDRQKVKQTVELVGTADDRGEVVRLVGVGDFLDFLSPSGRRKLVAADLYDSSRKSIEEAMWARVKEFGDFMAPIAKNFWGAVSGHHKYVFGIEKLSGPWLGRSSDEWLMSRLKAEYWGTGTAHLDIHIRPNEVDGLHLMAFHGGGGARTLGGQVQKREHFSRIAPGAHIIATGHDNSRFAVTKAGLHARHGEFKQILIATGAYQKGYLEQLEAGYAEQAGFAPTVLGSSQAIIHYDPRKTSWPVEFHALI